MWRLFPNSPLTLWPWPAERKRPARDTEGRYVSSSRIRIRAKARDMAIRQGMTEQADILA